MFCVCVYAKTKRQQGPFPPPQDARAQSTIVLHLSRINLNIHSIAHLPSHRIRVNLAHVRAGVVFLDIRNA